MSRFVLLFLGLLFSAAVPLLAQKLDYRQGELIVQLGADVDAKAWTQTKPELLAATPISRTLNIYLLRFDYTRYAENQLRRTYWRDPAVELVQLNHLLTYRREPNDLRYPQQWQYRNRGQINGTVGADLNVEPAWDVTTGGRTANGDTIVVAILDSGTDTDHEDLVANLWRNNDEIPNNDVDDDNNGFVDDYFGYNTAADNGDVDARSDGHGVSVTGIIGATGNNKIGVAGVNWTVELMTIKNDFLNSEAEVLQAYSYVLESRLAYDASNGEKGAYVVATNASWGLDLGRPEDSPVWCRLYDRLGAVGILNMGAVINGNINVDVEGDLPTNCPSEYLIGVTNLNTNDEKVNAAGFGATSIDLGAYGDEVFTTTQNNTYGSFSGTSSATPHVTGAAALLYSAPCETFGQLLAVDPAVAALMVREILLST
ncbi:MAG: S8 family serine peptidase, partial [Bacteroidota bacterium]